MNAHRITRTGPARARGAHLQAANDAHGCGRCNPRDNRQGRDCECSRYTTRETALAWAAWIGVPVGGWLLVYVIAEWLSRQQ